MEEPTLQQVAGSALVLTDAKRQAVVLIAEGGRTYQQIADELNIDRITLFRWRREAAFDQALRELKADLEEETRQYAVANRRLLLEGLTERRERLLRIVAERERYHTEHQTGHPGASTGYMAKDVKNIGSGPTAYPVDVWTVDRPLVASLIEVETFGAKLAGILVDRQDVRADLNVHVGPPSIVRIREQKPNPYAKNRDTELPAPGEYVQQPDGTWVHAETGQPYEPKAIEGQYREVGSGKADGGR